MEEEMILDKKKKIKIILMYFCLSLAFVSSVTNMVLYILNNSINIGRIITVILLALFSLGLIFMALFMKGQKTRIIITVVSIFIIIFSTVEMIFNLPKSDLVLDFVGKDIKELVTWAEDRNIIVEQKFEYNDTISKYEIIRQDIKAGTNVKKIKKITVLVSDGIDESKKTEVNNMVGWKLDDVIKFIDDNHLTSVTILFEYNDEVKKDIIFEQDILKSIKRNEPITLKCSLGKEGSLKNVTMENLVGMDTFHASIYLGRNDLKYEIVYTYSEDKLEGTVLKQSIKKWQVVKRDNYEPIIITVAKQNEITMIDLSKMTQTEVTSWVTNNRLKVEFTDDYDDSIKEGKVISYKPKKGSTMNIDDTVYVTISKGPLYMPKFTTIDDFRNWANEYNITYNIDYQYNSSIKIGELISSSHKEGQIVKRNDNIKLVISQGSSTFVPDFIGMNKKEAQDVCKKANIICKLNYLDNNTEYDTVIKQSIGKGASVPSGTSVTITFGE